MESFLKICNKIQWLDLKIIMDFDRFQTEFKRSDRYSMAQLTSKQRSKHQAHHDSIFGTNDQSVSTELISIELNSTSKQQRKSSCNFITNRHASVDVIHGSSVGDLNLPMAQHSADQKAGFSVQQQRKILEASHSLKPIQKLTANGRSSILAQGSNSNFDSFTGPTLGSASDQSGLEISKKDLQAYLSHGGINKGFITKNRKELQSFIKSQRRKSVATGPSQESLDQYYGYAGPSSGNGGSEDVTADEASAELVEKKDVRPVKGFTGITSNITPKVVEQWLNQTLSDAEHMNIPQVLLKPASKVPVTRYSIDRNGLLLAGIHNDQVNDLYRALFVYSVGFFEKVKVILSNCAKNDRIKTVKAIWKVYIVLLEYCCRQDYRLQIEEIQAQQKDELEETRSQFQLQIEDLKNQKQQLMRNLNAKDILIEQSEKEVRVEQQTRSQLEEEYTQMQQNHENEIQLRLQFESRLKDLHQEHRKLEIENEKTNHIYQITNEQLTRYESLCQKQSSQLLEIRESQTEDKARLQILEEYETFASTDLKHKTQALNNSEIFRKKAQNECEEMKSRRLDADNQSKRLDLSNKDLLSQYNSVLQQLKNQERHILDQREQIANGQLKYEEERSKYEILATGNSTVQQEYQRIKTESRAHTSLIWGLREELERVYMQLEDNTTRLNKWRIDHQMMKETLKTKSEEHTECFEQLKVINHKRHEYTDRYKQKCIENENLQNHIVDIQEQLHAYIRKHQELIQEFKVYREQSESAIKKLGNENVNLQNKLTQERETVKGLKLELKNAKASIDYWTNRADEFQRLADDTQQELQRTENFLQVEQEAHRKTRRALEKATKENQKLSKFLTKERSHLKELQDDLKASHAENLALMESNRLLKQMHGEESTALRSQLENECLQRRIQVDEQCMIAEDAWSFLLQMKEQFPRVADAENLYLEAATLKRDAEEAARELRCKIVRRDHKYRRMRAHAKKAYQVTDRQQKDFTKAMTELIQLETKRSKGLETRYQTLKNDYNDTQTAFKSQIKRLEEDLVRQKKTKNAQERRTKILDRDGSQKSLKTKRDIVKKKVQDPVNENLDQEVQESLEPISEEQAQAQAEVENKFTTLSSIEAVQSPDQVEQPPPSNRSRESEQSKRSEMQVNLKHSQTEIVRQKFAEDSSEVKSAFTSIQSESEIEEGEDIESGSSDESVQEQQFLEMEETGETSSDGSLFEEDEISLTTATMPPSEVDTTPLESEESMGSLDLGENGPDSLSQEELFQHFLAYTLRLDRRTLDFIVERLKNGNARMHPPKFKAMPSIFKRLRLTDEQQTDIENQRQQLLDKYMEEHAYLLRKIEELLPASQKRKKPLDKFLLFARRGALPEGLSDGDEDQEPIDHRQVLGSVYSRFAQNHIGTLCSLIEKDLRKLEITAQKRQKPHFKPPNVRHQKQGAERYHYLIRMSKEEEQYDKHRQGLLQELNKANQDHKLGVRRQEPTSREDVEAKIRAARDLERHRRKVANLVIERPYLKKLKKVAPLQDSPDRSPSIRSTSSFLMQEFQNVMDQQKIELIGSSNQENEELEEEALRKTVDNLQMEQHQTHHAQPVLESVSTLLHKVRVVDNENFKNSKIIEEGLGAVIKGGVAGINREIREVRDGSLSPNRSPDGRESPSRRIKGPSTIRTMIRAADSRYE